MELQIVVWTTLFIGGVIVGRWTKRAGWNHTTGGTRIPLNEGGSVQVSGPIAVRMLTVLRPHERTQLEVAVAQGRLAEAEALLREAFQRWINSDEGQDWAHDHAPFLVRD